MTPSHAIKDSSQPTIVFAGGGSGGHISPSLAIAERLAESEPTIGSLFLCSERTIDRHMLDQARVDYLPIPAAPFSAKPGAALRFLSSFRKSRRACGRLFRELDVRHVVAMGGFVAAPVVAEARARSIPVTLVNLDDPPGKANRLMARRCGRVLTAIELPSNPGFAERVVGMPIRRSAMAPVEPAECRRRLDLAPDLHTLLVTGASQGATSVNRLMVAMASSDPAVFDGWQILHLAGSGSADEIAALYEEAGVKSKVLAFLDEMGLAWGAADLAISRAGANSVAEAAANCVPTLFLPYPHHRDMHQRRNAQPLVDVGAAVIEIDLIDPARNIQAAGPAIQSLMQAEDRRLAMRQALEAYRRPDAAAEICDLLLSG